MNSAIAIAFLGIDVGIPKSPTFLGSSYLTLPKDTLQCSFDDLSTTITSGESLDNSTTATFQVGTEEEQSPFNMA